MSKVTHIFRGIPPAKFKPTRRPGQNLAELLDDFKRVGIIIHPTCRIANSTLAKLVETVNNMFSPDLPSGLSEVDELILSAGTADERMQAFVDDLEESAETHNLNISIGAGVRIGENVAIIVSVEIGANTVIEDKVVLAEFVKIGKDCVIGRAAFVNANCSIGDGTTVQARTTFPPETIVPPHSVVVHEHQDSTSPKIMPRLSTVKSP